MLLEKIEKYSELSFTQQKPQSNKAAIQSCYFNLNNLKKIILENINEDRKVVQNSKITGLPEKQFCSATVRLPDISVTNSRTIDEHLSQDLLKDRSLNCSKSFEATAITRKKEEFMLIKQFGKIREQYFGSNKERIGLAQNTGKQNNKKVFQIRRKKARKIEALTKSQKYFEDTKVQLSQSKIEKIGLYQASNLYKKANIDKFLKQGYQNKFKPVINLKFATFTLCDRNQFFLTGNSCMPSSYDLESWGVPQETQSITTKPLIAERRNKKQVKLADLKPVQNQLRQICEDELKQNLQENSTNSLDKPSDEKHRNVDWIITITNYAVTKNQQYYGLKVSNMQQWGQISFIIHRICLYLKKVKISLLSFKFETKIFMRQLWSGKNLSEKQLEKVLKIRVTLKNSEYEVRKSIRLFNNRTEVIKQVARMWRDRQKLLKMKKQKQKQHQRLVWSSIRIMAKHRMMKAKKKRTQRALLLNQKLRNGDWDYEVQIHIPSFSQSQFVRNTTQYMQHFENMFFHMWKLSNKQFVLIIPAINQFLLQMFQQKFRPSKNITIICPESHQLYPKSLPLSACLLYSKEGLYKIKKLLDGRKGIIIPGRSICSKYLYEEHLSDILNCPLFSTFSVPRSIGEGKNIWRKYEIPTSAFIEISPQSKTRDLIDRFAEIICQNPKVSVWVIKINAQFNGRGIAKFNTFSSKKLKQILSLSEVSAQNNTQESSKISKKLQNEIKSMLVSYLQVHFRLKIKINFQNCIYRVEEYIDKLLLKGGVIEQFVEDCQTYQFCYKLQPGYSNYSHLYILDEIQEEKYICCTQNFQIDFVTKASLFQHNNLPKILRGFSKKLQKVLKSERYLGYISITVLYSPKKQRIYGVQIKPYMTMNSSMSYLLKLFLNKKPTQQNFHRRNGNIVSNSNITEKHQFNYLQNTQQKNNPLVFLFVPFIVFTDVDEIERGEIIQSLVSESWGKISAKLFTEPLVSQNPDTFNGTLYLSLGLCLGMLIYGKAFDIKKMKSQCIETIRTLSEKLDSIKMYRGKQQLRDVFQFGDLIRAITKIK